MQQATALKILKSGQNVFLTGSAGSGKTYTLTQYIDYLKAHKVPVAVTASTGIAATHMNGMTIHTWAGIGIKDTLTEQDLKKLRERKYLRNHIEKARVLVIDEISMLHARQFNLVNQVLQYFKAPDKAFGGMQVIVAGDFFQLPPVGHPGESNRDKFAFMSDAWQAAGFNLCYLTEQHRQGHNQLNSILNEIREGHISPQSISALTATRSNLLGDDITRLFTHNADVDSINEQQLQRITTKAHTFTATLSGNEKLLMTLQNSVRAPQQLVLKKHAKVMFVKNNFDEGYINGSLGEVVGFVKDDEYGLLPEVKLRDGSLITVMPAEWSVENEHGQAIASFKQIPLRHAWAITVHKSQGMTLDAAEIDLSQTFEKGQGYVALSRLKSLDGLRLLGLNPNALALDQLAIKANARFLALSAQVEQQWQGQDATALHSQFIKSSGGTLNPRATQPRSDKLGQLKEQHTSPDQSSLLLTQTLFEQGLDIEEIAQQRGMTVYTIIGHLARLHGQNSQLSLERLKPDAMSLKLITRAVKKIKKQGLAEHFNEDGSMRLRPLFELLNEQYTYNQLKLALIFISP